MNAHASFEDAVPAYALDALDERERAEFEAHLVTCATCRQQLHEFRRVTAALGATVEEMAPPDSLKARTMARATSQPQAAPVQSPVMARAEPRPVDLTSFRWLSAAAGIVLIAGLAMYAASLRSQMSALRETVAAASARSEVLRDELASLRRDAARTMSVVGVLSAPNLITVQLQGQGSAAGTTGRAYLSAGRGLVFTADRLPALTPDRVYQLWAIPAEGPPISAGVFAAEPSGALGLAVDLPQGLGGVKTMAVTAEPGPRGSPGPTTPILMMGSVGS